MKLISIRIQNFRCFNDQVIHLNEYTCFVGPNGSGKSTILAALNVFFQNTTSSPTNVVTLTDEDFHLKDVSKPIQITLTFGSLNQAAQAAFQAYYRQNQLVVSAKAEWNSATSAAEVKQYGSRMVMVDFAPFFLAVENRAKAPDLKAIYVELRKKYGDLPAPTTKDAMEEALSSYETANPALCTLHESETQFYGWSKGANLLKQFLQWVFVPAVKDASTEQDEGRATALGQLLERTIRTKVSFETSIADLKAELEKKYRALLDKEQAALDKLTGSLTTRLRDWTHQNTSVAVRWHYNDNKSVSVAEPLARVFVGEHDFLGEISRLGHGVQRAFLVSLLQELAESSEGEDPPVLLLGFEEPELYQHPPQAKHMVLVLQQLVNKNAQIVVTTHSPYFISGKGFESVRMVRDSRKGKCSIVSAYTHTQLSERLAAILGKAPQLATTTMATIEQVMQPTQNELFFTKTAVLVEGLEDVAYISTHMQLSGKSDDFRKYGCHFVIAGGKTNISRPLAIAKGLGIPVFVVFDADTDDKVEQHARHQRDNGCILKLCDLPNADPMPKQIFWEEGVVMWPADIAKTVQAEFGNDVWEKSEQEAKSPSLLDVGCSLHVVGMREVIPVPNH